MSNAAFTVLPENIRANLAKCNNHKEMTCLECGYVGLMGVLRTEVKYRYPVIALALILIAILGIFDFSTILAKGVNGVPFWSYVLAALIFSPFLKTEKKFWLCPNCEKELLLKK